MTIDMTRRELLGLAGATVLAPRLAWGKGEGAGGAAFPGEIHQRAIPSSGERLPVVGLGSWQTFDVPADSDRLASLDEVLRLFFALGGRVIDSSPMYGQSERRIGELLMDIDDVDPFLATKVWTRGASAGRNQMRESMAAMGGRSRIDLMQIHNLVHWETHMQTLQAWKDRGLFRYIGITHYRPDAFDELARIMEAHPIDFVQLPYSVTNRRAEKRLLPLAKERGIAVLVMRPFEGGALFRATKGRELPAWASELGIATWAQFFLKWIIGNPAVTCPIPATGNPKHVVDNMRAGYGALPSQSQRDKMAAYFAE